MWLATAPGGSVTVGASVNTNSAVSQAPGAETEGQVCTMGVTVFSPFVAGYANAVPTFREVTVGALTFRVNEARARCYRRRRCGQLHAGAAALASGAELCRAQRHRAGGNGWAHSGRTTGGDGGACPHAEGGDTATLTFTLEAVRVPVQVTLTDATTQEGRPVKSTITLQWTASQPGSATAGEDHQADVAGQMTLPVGTTARALSVPTLDDRRVEPTEAFTVTIPMSTDALIKEDDTAQAWQRSLGIVLAG